MADDKENGMNEDQTEKSMSDYEELLNGFSGDDDSKEGQDGIALSELLDGIDAQDDSQENSGNAPQEPEEIDIDAIDDIDIDDFIGEPEEPDDNGIPEKTNSGTFDIDIDTDGDDDLGGYSSLLNELDGDEEEQAGEPEPESAMTQELSALEELDLPDEAPDITDEEIPETLSEEIMPDDESEPIEITDEAPGDEQDESGSTPTGEIPAVAENEAVDDIVAGLSDDSDRENDREAEEVIEALAGEEIEDVEEGETSLDLDEPVLDEIDYAEALNFAEDSADYEPEEETVSADSDVSYAGIMDEDIVVETDEAAEEEVSSGEYDFDSDLEALNLDETAEDTGDDLSYASILDDTPDSGGQSGERGDLVNRASLDTFGSEEFSLDELDSVDDDIASFGEEFEADTDSGDSSLDDFLVSESGEDEFVISGADDSDNEGDFLGLHEDAGDTDDGEEDLIPGVADVTSSLNTEVIIEGFEMDVEEQLRAVTRAELLLAQGNKGDATNIYIQIVENKGVTPWVAKRCAELGIDIQNASVAAESEEVVE